MNFLKQLLHIHQWQHLDYVVSYKKEIVICINHCPLCGKREFSYGAIVKEEDREKEMNELKTAHASA